MSDINWPAWSMDGERLLELLPALCLPALNRAEVLALGDGWCRNRREFGYGEARRKAFKVLWRRRPTTIQEDAWGVAWKRASASGEWRGGLLNQACHAVTDAAIGRYTAKWTGATRVGLLDRTWREVVELPGRRLVEPAPVEMAQPRLPGSVADFVSRCQSHGWDEAYVRALTWDGAYEEALRRCRATTMAAGRDALARLAVSEATTIPTPGGCYPDETTMLVETFYRALAEAAEAVVARDLLDPADLATLTSTWQAHFGPLK